MFVELNKENCYVLYLQNKEGVSIENKDTIIEITEELYCLLKSKMPWKIEKIENKIYAKEDINLFIEIVSTIYLTQEERLNLIQKALEGILLGGGL